MLKDMAAHEHRILLRKYVVPVEVFPHEKRNVYAARVQHLRKLNADQAATHDNGMRSILYVFFEQVDVLQGVQALHAGQILSGPAELVRCRTGRNHELVVPMVLTVFECNGSCVSIDCRCTTMNKLYAVLLPKPIFIRLGVFVLHVSHENVHQRGTGEEMFRLTGNDRDAHVAFLADMPGNGDAGNAVSNDDEMLL